MSSIPSLRQHEIIVSMQDYGIFFDLCVAIINNFILHGPKTLQLRIPPSPSKQPHLVLALPHSQSFNAYDSLYHMGKK
jgi:hypothetical protein